MRTTARILTFATFAFATALPLHAQPKEVAEVTPLPANVERPNKGKGKGKMRGKMQGNGAKRDQKMIDDFETMFDRKLTDDQKAQIAKAAETRTAAVLAAQEAFNKEFAQIAGVTEKELREKRRAARQKEMGANGANENAARKARRKNNQNPGNLPDGTPADAPGVVAAPAAPVETPAN